MLSLSGHLAHTVSPAPPPNFYTTDSQSVFPPESLAWMTPCHQVPSFWKPCLTLFSAYRELSPSAVSFFILMFSAYLSLLDHGSPGQDHVFPILSFLDVFIEGLALSDWCMLPE